MVIKMSTKQKRLILFLVVLTVLISINGLQFAKLILKEPPYAYKVRGDRYRHLGLLNKALNEYDKAIYIKKDYPECYYWSAIIYKKKRLFTQALFNINSALKYKNKFHSKTMIFDTLYLKTEIYFTVEKDLIMIHKQLDGIIKMIRDLQAKLGTEFKSYLQYQLGKGFFYKAKFQYLSKTNIEESLRWFEEAKKARYKQDFVFYYKYKIYKSLYEVNKNKYQQSKSVRDKKKVKEYQKLAQDALADALKYNPNVISDFKRSELD